MPHVMKVNGVRGFIEDSWWILEDDGKCLATFLNKSEAYEFVDKLRRRNKTICVYLRRKRKRK